MDYLRQISFDSIADSVRARPVLFAATTIAGVATLSLSASNYREWLQLGPGGVPRNPLGWTFQMLLRLIAVRDTIDTNPFSNAANNPRYKPHVQH